MYILFLIIIKFSIFKLHNYKLCKIMYEVQLYINKTTFKVQKKKKKKKKKNIRKKKKKKKKKIQIDMNSFWYYNDTY